MRSYCTPLRSVPTCAAALVAASLLAGCVSPEEARQMGEARQIPRVFTDPQTGCQYFVFSGGSYGENSVARSDERGLHMGCRQAAQPASPTPRYGGAADVNQEPSK